MKSEVKESLKGVRTNILYTTRNLSMNTINCDDNESYVKAAQGSRIGYRQPRIKLLKPPRSIVMITVNIYINKELVERM